ncbi:MarR family winged helix-turn-helix transcriptional regulator [Marinobacter sp. F4206]|uniref:MarR family winged helix-turn-helix transcriptional regulator n=1 Tax=Marinobacter sp. F4206 TaxID=2861777 RepID=UPI001C5F3363|nr:MarR family transcriptional regulator [Marinobacter sp. F4206]MBW4933518.1 MarR family transcriptional regulator [Marinobacter sp. F4206]
MGGPDEALSLDNQICFALYAANRAVTARYRPLLDDLDLTYPQYLTMLVLWERESSGGATRVSDLGRRLRLDSGTLTPLLKRLADRGLLERRRSRVDERVVILTLTEAGRTLRKKARSIPERLLCEVGVEPERLQALREELKALLTVLEGKTGPND